jgi:outer membrane protein
MRFPLRFRAAGMAMSALVAITLRASPLLAQPADTLALSLADAVALALRNGEESRLAAAQVDLADNQVGVARASAFPQLRLSGNQTHVLENARAQAVGQIFNQPNTYNTNLNLSEALFQGGRVRAASRAASATRAAARLNAEDTRAQLSMDVQRAYVQALYADRLVTIRRAAFDLAAQRVTQVEQFEAGGRASRFDVLSARVERGNLEPLVVDAINQRDLALLDLRRLANIPAIQPIHLTTTIDPSAVQITLASITTDSSNGADRASVRAAEQVVHARRDGVSVARADMLPTFSVFVQSGFQAFPQNGFPTSRGSVTEVDCSTETSPGRTCTSQNGGWFSDRSVGFSLSWPLFDGLRAKSNMDLAETQQLIAEIQLQSEREAAATEVARARATLASAQSVFAARSDNSAEAEEAFSLASLRFGRGVGTQLEVSAAQVALLQAQTDEARAVYDLYLATAELARALGRPLPMPDGSGGRISNPIPPDGPAPIPPP